MKNYYRVMLGKGSVHVAECLAGSFIGADFGIHQDLTGKLPDEWRQFNKKFIPIYLDIHPGKSKVVAGLACGNLWTLAKGINKGDYVITPDGEGHYHIGEVSGDYFYRAEDILPHRRPIRWFGQSINRADMSDAFKRSAGAASAVINLSGYRDEIEHLLAGIPGPQIIATDETVEDPYAFAMEKHLEDFLVKNWSYAGFGKDYDIYEEEGECVGQQYATDTGPIDILAISKNKKILLVVELKKGRASDAVVGQVLRYMGYVKEELAEPGQQVKGIIIAMDDDPRLRRALAMVPDIEFYRYEVRFNLKKG